MDKNAAQFLELADRLGTLVRSNLRGVGGQNALQPVHLQALIYLAAANRYSNTPQALTDYLGLTKGTVSQSLLLLHARGLIERQVDSVDKRMVRLRSPMRACNCCMTVRCCRNGRKPSHISPRSAARLR